MARKTWSRGGTRCFCHVEVNLKCEVYTQNVKGSSEYLKVLGLVVNKVVQAQPYSIGVKGTPTVILVEDIGVIKNAWIGMIPPQK